MTKLQVVLRSVWIAVGVAMLSAIIVIAVQANMVLSEARRVTSQLTADDIRRVMDIVERQQLLEMEK